MVLFAMKEYTRAMEAAGQATEADVEKKHTAEIEGQLMKISQEVYKERSNETEEQTLQRAMRDPEIGVRTNYPPSLICHLSKRHLGHYVRPCDAVNPAAGTNEPGRFARSHEEPHDPAEDR